jgi:hypothetical protein
MPSIKNIFVNPRLTLLSDAPMADQRRAILRATGLMCGGL